MALMLQPRAEAGTLQHVDPSSRQPHAPSRLPHPPSSAPSSSRPSTSHPDSRSKDRDRERHGKGPRDPAQHSDKSKSRGRDPGSRDSAHHSDKSRGKEPAGSSRGHHSSSHRKGAPKDDKKAIQPYTSFTPDAKDNRLNRPSTFLCRMHFSTGLPEPASQPKLMPLKDDPQRYTAYVGSSLEREYRHRLHLEPDLGIPLDLLDLSPYVPPPESERPALDPEDELLLRDDDVSAVSAMISTPHGRAGSGSKHRLAGPRASLISAKPSVEGLSWLMSTQYITPMTAEGAAVKTEARSEQEVKMLALQLELAREEEQLSTREGRMRYIEESFKQARETPVHPTNPNLKPVEVLPVLPFQDRGLCREAQRFLHVMFDEPPLKDSKKHARLSKEAKDELETMALMKQYKTTASATGEPGKPFLAYMVPSSTNTEQVAASLDEGEEVPYTWVREYHYSLQVPKGDGEKEAFVLCFGDDSVQCLKLKGRLNLEKLKKHEVSRQSQQQQEEEGERARIPVPAKIRIRKMEGMEPLASSKRARV